MDVGGVRNRFSDSISRFVCIPHSSVNSPMTVASEDGGSAEDKYHQNDQSHRRDHQYCDASRNAGTRLGQQGVIPIDRLGRGLDPSVYHEQLPNRRLTRKTKSRITPVLPLKQWPLCGSFDNLVWPSCQRRIAVEYRRVGKDTAHGKTHTSRLPAPRKYQP
jgi:hypothetical protein